MAHSSDYEKNTRGAYAFQCVDDPDELEAVARDLFSQQNEAKRPICLQSFENAAYLLGNTHTRWYYTASGELGVHRLGIDDRSKFDSLIAKSADNRLIRPVESVASMLTVDQPEPRVKEKSPDPADRDTADISALWLKALWEAPLHMDELTYDAAVLGSVVPFVAIETIYDETDIPVMIPGEKVVTREDPLWGGEVEEVVPSGENEISYLRDFQTRLWNHFHIIPDPNATSWQDMTWVARQSYEYVERVREQFNHDLEFHYPENARELRAPAGKSVETSILYWWTKFQDIIPSPQYYTSSDGFLNKTFDNGGEGPGPDQIVLTVVDVKPSEEYPQGRTLVFGGDSILYNGPSRAWSKKYPWRWHPYAFWGWFKLPGKFDPVPMLSQLVPLQKKINAIDALVQANRQFMSIGQWLVPDHCDIPEGLMSGFFGHIIPYTASTNLPGPERIENQPLPAELQQERAILIQSIEWISGTGFSDPAVSPSALRSGAQMQMQQRERLMAKTPMLRRFASMIETVAQNVLIETQRALDAGDAELRERLGAVATEYGEMNFANFENSSLRDHHDVSIDIISGQFNTPEAQAQKAMEFWQFSGGQLPPVAMSGVLRKLGLDDFAVEKENQSVRYAERVLSRIRLGHFDELDPAKTETLLAPGVASASAMLPVFQNAILHDTFHGLDERQKQIVMAAHEILGQKAAEEQQIQMQQMALMAQLQKGEAPGQQAAE